METKKLTLEDLKLESFLTEIDQSKLTKVQGGNGAYAGNTEDGCDTEGGDACGNSGMCNSCECPTATQDTYECTESNYNPCNTDQIETESEYYTCGDNCHDGGTGWHC